MRLVYRNLEPKGNRKIPWRTCGILSRSSRPHSSMNLALRLITSALLELIIVRVIQKSCAHAGRSCCRPAELFNLSLDLSKISLLASRQIIQIPLHLLLGHNEGSVGAGHRAQIGATIIQVAAEGRPARRLIPSKWCLSKTVRSDQHQRNENGTKSNSFRGHFRDL